MADVEEEMLRWSRTWMWRWIWWRRGVEGGGGGTVDTMEGQDPTTVTLLHTNQSGALSLSMMMHFILKKGRVASFNVFHNKVQLVNKRVILYGYVVISSKAH